MPRGQIEFDSDVFNDSLQFIALCNSSVLGLLSQMLERLGDSPLDVPQHQLLERYMREIKTNYLVNESFIWGLRKSFENRRASSRSIIDCLLDYTEPEGESAKPSPFKAN